MALSAGLPASAFARDEPVRKRKLDFPLKEAGIDRKSSSSKTTPILAALFLVLACHLLPGPAWAKPGTLGEWLNEEEAKGYVPADLPLRPVPPRPNEQHGPQVLPIVRRVLDQDAAGPLLQQGSLSGKSVYLSPGHGWTYSSASGWYTQRGNTHGVVEDMSNGDGIDEFLVPYLLGAGAFVVPVREIDTTSSMVILDQSDKTASPARGKYTESGQASLFSDSTLKGWGHPTLPLSGEVNPFGLGGNRLMQASAQETAHAAFVPNVPQAGFYNVYVSYSMYTSRASDARFTVLHPGGKTVFFVDQRRQGGTWVLLGRFFFDKGTNETSGAVVVSNQSQDSGAYVSLDAVRLGGGTGLIDRGAGSSGRARADENSRYHAQFAGAPASVYNSSSSADSTDDVSARSRFADWAHAPGEPAVFISHHSNAYNASARGTETYIYGTNPPDGSYQPTSTTLALGSDKLASAVHDRIISDLRAAYEPGWIDRKVKSAYFGELNTAYQDEMASALLEVSFHDQATDAAALKDAAFRRLVARAIYKGIVAYFAVKDGIAPQYLPEPPRGVVARGTGQGQVTVSFRAPASGGVYGHPATSYRVYRGSHGYAFDNGTDTQGKTSLTLTGLPPGKVVYLRVTALNKGGESLPSPTLAVGISSGAKVALLLVTGFDRLDSSMNLKLTYPKVGATDRLLLDRINNGTYLAQHGKALAGTLVPFDACTHDAIDDGAVALGGYSLVLWQGGKGLSGGLALTQKGRAALSQAAAAGVSLAMSGSVIARSLGGTSASAQDRAFLAQGLRASFVSAQSMFSEVGAAGGGFLSGLSPFNLASQSAGPYDVQIPDVVAAAGGMLAASYTGGGGAITQFRQNKQCAVLLGFPLEGVLPQARQAEVVSKLLTFCKVEPPASPDGGAAGPDRGAATGDGSGEQQQAGGDPRQDGGSQEGEAGCGCTAAGQREMHGGGARGWVLLLALAAAAWCSRRRPVNRRVA